MFAFLKIDLFLFSIDEEFNITPEITLVDFDLPFTRVPTLANELPNGVLQLNMGKFADLRLEGDDTDIAENFVVTQGDDDGHVKVTAFGYTQTYAVSSKIIALGGEGNDTIDLSGVTNASIEFEIEGGVGDDIIKAGAGKAIIRGGSGDDKIDGTDSDDQIFGEEGNDVIDGKGGNDLVTGDKGKYSTDGLTFTANAALSDGADIIIGGAGNDLLIGGGNGAGGIDRIGGDLDPDDGDADDGDTGNDIIIGDGAKLALGAVNDYHSVTAILDTGSGSGGNDVIFGNRGNDTIYAGKGDDQIKAGAGNDSVFAEAGFDTVDAGDGNDTVSGGLGDDIINGNAGNDILSGDEGKDRIHGHTGLDQIHGGIGADLIWGDEDNDIITGGSDGDIIQGGGGNDDIDAGAGSNTVWGDDKTGDPSTGAEGSDHIVAFGGDDIIHGQGGNEIIDAGDGNNTIFADDGNDHVTAGKGNHFILGNAGNDIIIAGIGNSVIRGNAGADTITVAGGNNRIVGDGGVSLDGTDISDLDEGDDGADIITTGAGNDFIYGYGGIDVIHSGGGNDQIFGGKGGDQIYGGASSDSIFGEDGNDTIYANETAFGDPTETASFHTIGAGAGNDIVYGDFGADNILAGEGDDQIFARAGNDYVEGNLGDDLIEGGTGDDTLVGGIGDDTIRGEGGNDIVWGGFKDFERAALLASFTNPSGYDAAETRYPTGYTPPLITPAVLNFQSLDGVFDDEPGNPQDFNDHLFGGAGTDWMFGGGGRDELFGGGDGDYLDGGSERDEVFGEGGDDIVRGGKNDDVVHGDYKYAVGSSPLIGDEGTDQVYGDGGSDFLFGDFAPAIAVGATLPDGRVPRGNGQRLFGGDGIDFLYAYAGVGITATQVQLEAEYNLRGDELHGGSGGDWLYGNLRQDTLIGDSGNDYLHGDYLAGPLLAQNIFANITGGADELHGGTGEDQLLGGGGNDLLWGGGDTDWLEGQKGDDTLYGGGAIDMMVLDTRIEYFFQGNPKVPLPVPATDTFDGHFGNDFEGDIGDDNATDIVLVEGTSQDDVIRIGQLADGRAHVNMQTIDPDTGATLNWEILVPWRSAPSAAFPLGRPLVEQFRISGLLGDDNISFVDAPYTAFGRNIAPLDIGDLNARSDDFVGVIDGGPGNDILRGTAGRDRLDGMSGSDTLFGLAGDDRLWGDSTSGEEAGPSNDYDKIFGGRGNDDLIGGPGINDLYAWTQDPQPTGDPDFGVFVDPTNPNGPVFDANADLNRDGTKDRILEDTGLDRMLGSRNADRLYAGTGLAFMFGNGGDDEMFRADGTLFESLDGGLNGDEWKQFLKESGRVFYVAGSEGDDRITVDFVNEPGLLGDHHLVTRLISNGDGTFSFAALVKLDFNATDQSGNPLFDAADLVIRLEGLQQRGNQQNSSTPDTTLSPTGLAQTAVGLESAATLHGLLPAEGDFDVILIDALGGEDEILVGPTVQKTVWIDAGAGDDKVIISGGNVILTDRSELQNPNPGLPPRNDTRQTAYSLVTDALAESARFTGFTIDSPEDVDWYTFRLAAAPNADSRLTLTSKSDLDGLSLQLFGSDGTALDAGLLQVGRDRIDLQAVAADTPASAFLLPAVQNLGRVTGLSIHSQLDADVFRFTLDREGVAGDRVNLLRESIDDQTIIELLDLAGNVIQAGIATAPLVRSVELAGRAAGDYLVRVRTLGALSRYSLVFQVPALQKFESSISGATNDTKETALDLGALHNFPLVTGLNLAPAGQDWFAFSLARDGSASDRIDLVKALSSNTFTLEVLKLDGTPALDENGDLLVVIDLSATTRSVSLNHLAAGNYLLKVTSASGGAYSLKPGDKVTERNIVESQTSGGLMRTEIRTVRDFGETQLDLSGKQTTFLDLSGLQAGVDYFLRVSAPNRLPTQYDMSFDLRDDIDPSENTTDFAVKADPIRRDIIIGGAGNDALQGGPGEDWIFGGSGNDVLSGGYDRQSEDLMFGGEGDDTFQILPDGLPFIKGSDETFIPTLTDRMDGGPGDDRVLFKGGDLDRLSQPIPDWVAIRWNRFLQRYEFTAVPWDIANQRFAIDQTVVNATAPGPLTGFVGTLEFRLRVIDPAHPDRGFVTVTAAIDATNITKLAEDLQAALDGMFGPGLVTVEFPDGVFRLRAEGADLELRAEATDPIVTALHFQPLTAGSPIYRQDFAFYQTISVEHTVIDTGAGDDIVRGDSEYLFPNVPSEWGIDPGDFEQRALIGALEIYGGNGNDRLFGGALNDRIDGGSGADVIFGGGGDDRLFGGPGRDLIAGNSVLEPDALEFTNRVGVSDRNDLVTLAAQLPAVRAGSTIDGLNIDIDDNGDWYVISAPEAIRRFGASTGALLTSDMIEVSEMVDSEGGQVPTGNHVRAFLYAAENIAAPGAPMQLVPRERASGVAAFYLLHVTDELEPSSANAGSSIKFDGVDDQVQVAADPSLNLLRQLTVEFWFQVDVPQNSDGTLNLGTGVDWMPLVYKGNDSTKAVEDRTYTVWLNRNGFVHFTSANGIFQDGVVNTSSFAVKAGQWYHFAGVLDRDNGRMRAYLNGALAGTGFVGTSDARSNAGSALHIGDTPERSGVPSFRAFKGLIDEVRLWNVAREETDIQRAAQRIVDNTASGLVGYWRFEETEGATLLDQSPLGNDGELRLNPDSVVTSGDNTAVNLARVDGRELILPFGIGRFGSGLYQISFDDRLGDTLHVPGSEAEQVFPALQLGGQPVLINLGDIDGDGFDDAVVSVQDQARDASGNLRNFARIAFGTAEGLDPDRFSPPITLELPEPVLSTDPLHRSVISAAGDIDNDGFGDIAIAVTSGGTNSKVYILFGREDWASGNVAADQGLIGEYFFLQDLPSVFTFPNLDARTPDLIRTDAQIDFANTGGAFPGTSDTDVFAVRWTGQIKIDQPGLYTFFLASDDGSRLFIDDLLVIDHGGLHGFSEKSGTFSFAQAGFYNIRVEMFENFGSAGVQLSWDPPSLAQGKQIIPTSVLFRDARDVINVATDRDIELDGFNGPVVATGGGDITPVVGTGILGEYFLEPTLEALKFNGNQFVEAANSSSLNLTRQVTLEARLKVDAFANQWMPVVQKGDGSGQLGRTYSVWVNQNGYLHFSSSDGVTHNFVNTGLGSIQLGQWYEFAGVIDRDAGQMRVYLNGALVAQTSIGTGDSVSTSTALLIGDTLEKTTPVSSSYSPFRGVIDQVAVWRSVRSATEIAGDAANPLAGSETGLSALWRFNEADGTAAGDATANANDGVLGGSDPMRAPLRVQGQLRQIPDFTGLTPTHTRTDQIISFSDLGGNFAGFPDLVDLYAVRWTGQIFVPTSGNISFGFVANDAARLFIDGELVAQTVLGDSGTAIATIHLDAGFHDLRFEYIDNVGFGLVALGWDLAGNNDLAQLEVIPAEAFVRTDASAADPTLHGADDLLISDGTSVRMVHGRARGDWTNLDAADVPAFFLGSGSITALGDVNRDGRGDFAVLRSGQLRIYSGGGVPQNPQLLSIVAGVPANVEVLAAGDVDGDAAGDILLTGTGGNYLIFGGELAAAETFGAMLTSHEAIALPDGAWRAIGDFDGNHDIDGDGNGDRFDDLAAAVLLTTDRLNESGELQHQVVNLFLGAGRADLIARFGAADPVADVVFEPGRARFSTPGALAPASILFGPVGDRTSDGLTRTLLALSGPGGDGLAIFDGKNLTDADETEPAPPAAAPTEVYQFELTDPTAPGFIQSPPPGIDLANDSNPSPRDAFVLEGSEQNEHLGPSQALADFNGDSFSDLLIQGDAATYVLFGPVQVDDRLSIAEEADLVVDADVGRAASRMGDVTGDGLADLVFVRPTTVGNFEITIIAGGNGAGIDLPRHVNRAWINSLASGNARVHVRSVSGFGYADAGASFTVLNWNDNGFADLAMVRRSAVVTPEQGFIIDGNTLWNGAGTITAASAAGKLALITPDGTNHHTEALAVLGTGAAAKAASAVQVPQVQAINAGDVNGDGLDDLLLADTGFIVFPAGGGAGGGSLSTSDPNVGRAYLLTGRTAVSGGLNLATGAELIVQDFSLGGSLSALGDLNRDGYDDFAIGSTAEGRRVGQDDTSREGGLFVFLGKADFGPLGTKVSPESADIIVARDARDNIPDGRTFNGVLNATAGDFDGDGRMDLVVGEPSRITTVTGTSTILDQDESGRLSVFFQVVGRGHLLALTQADKSVSADFDFDNLGVLPTTPGFDLDFDGLDDLVVAASGADVIGNDVLPSAGKALFIYGASARSNLPPSAAELANRTFTGSGNYLVDNGTGRAEVFKDPPGVDNPRFTLEAGQQDIWYKFTTLGDGMPGNAIRITPGLVDGFIAPIAPSADTATVNPAQAVGNSLFQRAAVYASSGSLFVGDAFTQTGRLNGWTLFSGNFGDDAGSTTDDRYVTPVIFKDAADGKFQITGIGTARKIDPKVALTFDFGLVSGSDAVGEGYFLGWKDGTTTRDNAGAVSYDIGGDTVRWLGAGQAAAGNVTAGRTLNSIGTFSQSYSIQGMVSTGAVLEFDLGRLLALAGNPDGVGSAKLVLDAPTATDPVLAPLAIQSIQYSGGKLYFTAFDESKGFELWVTDGTPQGTKLVRDLIPGVVSSLPSNLIDLGGTLYFTANAVSSGTTLFRTDGTFDGTVQVADITGVPSQFIKQLGAAELTAALNAPTDGVPDVDYTFTLEILRQDGRLDAVDVTIARDAFNDNTTTAPLFTQLDAALTAALTGDLVGDVSVSSDGTRFSFAANQADIVRLTVKNAPHLGFGALQASPPSVVLTAGSAPASFTFAADLTFTLDLQTVGGAIAPIDLTITAAATAGNTTLANLVSDLQTALTRLWSPTDLQRVQWLSASKATPIKLSSNEPGVIALTVRGAAVTRARLCRRRRLGPQRGFGRAKSRTRRRPTAGRSQFHVEDLEGRRPERGAHCSAVGEYDPRQRIARESGYATADCHQQRAHQRRHHR